MKFHDRDIDLDFNAYGIFGGLTIRVLDGFLRAGVEELRQRLCLVCEKGGEKEGLIYYG